MQRGGTPHLLHCKMAVEVGEIMVQRTWGSWVVELGLEDERGKKVRTGKVM